MNRYRNLLTALAVFALAGLAASCKSTQVNAPGDGQVLLSANPTRIVLDEHAIPPVTSGSSLVTAQIFDVNGSPLPNVSVVFLTDGGVMASTPPGQPPTALETDFDGKVSDTLTVQLGDPDDITVTIQSGTLSDSIPIEKIERPANQAPFPDIFIDPQNSALINEVVIFDATGSVDPDGDAITCYQWQIESSENLVTPALACTPANPRCQIVQGSSATIFTRSYAVVQNLAITLRVTDDPAVACAAGGPAEPASAFNGVTATAYEVVCDRTNPVAAAGPNRTVALNGGTSVPVPLSSTGSFDTESGIVTYQWECGNAAGDVLNGASVVCTYTTTGSKTVTLTVVNGCGMVATDAAIVTVNP